MKGRSNMSTGLALAPTDLDLAERDLRTANVQAALAGLGADALIAYGPAWRRENVRYLLNAPVRGDVSLAVMDAAGQITAFSSRSSDIQRIREAGWAAESFQLDGSLAALVEVLHGMAVSKVAIAHLELVPAGLLRALRTAIGSAEIVSATPLLDTVRLTKSAWELDRHRTGARIADLGWKRFVEVLEPGLPEFHITAEVEATLRAAGADDNFMLMASGGDEVRGMVPPGNRVLAEHDLVRTELTPQFGGYWTQICRSASVGTPTDGQRKSFDLFNEALHAGLDVVKAGVTCHEVARAENEVFEKLGFGEYCGSQWTRVRGHNLGLHPDESHIAEGNHTVLPAGAVVIVHPNTYTPLAGYQVLGEPVIVTETGYERLLTTDVKLFSNAEALR